MAFRGLLKSSDPHAVCEHQTANRGLDDQSAQQSNYLGALVGHSANPRRTHGRERQCCASTRRRPARAFVTDRRRSMRYLRFRHYDAGCSMPMPLELAQYRETLEWHQPILHRFRCKSLNGQNFFTTETTVSIVAYIVLLVVAAVDNCGGVTKLGPLPQA